VTEIQNSSDKIHISWLIKLLQNSILIQGAFLFLAWLAVWQVGRLVEYTDHASVWFPVAGLTFSCFLVLGRRAFLPIMLGAIMITIWNGNHYNIPLSLNEFIWAGFLFGLAHILPYWMGALVIARISKNANQNAPKLIVTFLIVACITALIATLLVISSLVVTNQMDMADVSKTLLPFWVGDMAGVIVLTTLFSGILIYLFPNTNITLNEFTHEPLGTLKSLINKIGLNVFLIFITMLLAYISNAPESSFAIFFLAVTHMWIACTESPKFNVLSLAVSSFLIVLLVHIFSLMEHVMVYQFAINVIAANALFGIAIPQLKANNRELQHKVFTDELTQVSSRHHMQEIAKLEIERCYEQNLKLSFVIFDIDDFKLINDKYGHSIGDEALINLCNKTKDLLYENETLARFGGDEFVLLLPGLDINAAHIKVKNIRKSISEIKIGSILMSSSFGISELKQNEDFSSLFKRADKALYVSKNAGGDQINLADNFI
jgi:diguanylate cyclase (GGDEF)-like protein